MNNEELNKIIMKDEIKEILDKLKDTADTSFFAICGTKEELENIPKSISKALHITDKHAKLLLDYITNLQEENENLQEKLNLAMETIDIGVENTYIKTTDYKKRIDKAIEWVKKNMYYFPRPDELLNILQGSDKEC